MKQFLLSSIIFLPLILALVVLIIPAKNQAAQRMLALLGSIWILIASLYIWLTSDTQSGIYLHELAPWFSIELSSLGTLKFDYFILADGLNLPLLLLTGISLTAGALASWKVREKSKAYFSLYLLLAASIAGCFLSMDFLLFFLFFEFMLLPMYFLIGIWGGPRRSYASIKFFLYTLFGSLLILIVMVAMYGNVVDLDASAAKIGLSENQSNIEYINEGIENGNLLKRDLVFSNHFVSLRTTLNEQSTQVLAGGMLDGSVENTFMGRPLRYWAFLLLLIGFLIKLPAVPFHTWLPDAHVEASTAISVVLAAILLKIGGYGLLRIVYPAFPDAALHYAWWVGLLGVIAIIYGAMNALAQKDLKKLVAYSSISHMGFVLLGLASFTSEGLNGAYYQLFSHGLISAMLFVVAGVIYDRTHDRMIQNYAGLATIMPKFAVLASVAFFASLGLPGFSGFIAEIMVLLGAFHSDSVNSLIPIWMAIVAALGLILAAAYCLWTLQRMFFGKVFLRKEIWRLEMVDLSSREMLILVPLAVLTLVFGIFPSLLLSVTEGAIEPLIQQVFDNAAMFNAKLGGQ
ncbi:NuoM family protein [Fulvivirgaceae bacterium LMO-SS25]